MKLGIVGQGAIGSLFAYYFQHYSPIILVKDENKENKTLIKLSGQKTTLNFKKKTISLSTNCSNENEVLDLILITVKGYQIPALIKQLCPWVSETTRLILIQNGMGGAELLAEAFPNHRIYLGTTTDAVYKVDALNYQITAIGQLDIGPLWLLPEGHGYAPQIKNQEAEEKWARQFFSSHPHPQYHQNIAPALYKKLAINTVINSLTAIMNIKNGQLVHHQEQVKSLQEEIFTIYEAAQIEFSRASLSTAINDVILATRDNWSSMHQDLANGRQTENETVLGYMVNLAKQFDLETPHLRLLYEQLRQYDNKSTTGVSP